MRRLFGRRGRHAAGRVVFVGRPPGPPAPAPPPLPAARMVAPAPAAPAPAPPVRAAAPTAPAARAAESPLRHPVRLGFADGSELSLPAEDPAAAALRDLADRLAGGTG